MNVVYPHCAGIDIHKQTMTVCVFDDPGQGQAPNLSRRTLPTHAEGIRELMEWLSSQRVTEVGMESTGVYWKPVWNALEGSFGLHLCNPQHIRAIPGSKTDLRDGTRIAEMLAHGKLPTSFIPPLWQRELRDLTRMRASLTQERTRIGNRIEKVLEDAQIKLGCVASEVLGVSGRAMLEALVKGETDEEVLTAFSHTISRIAPQWLRSGFRTALGRVPEADRFVEGHFLRWNGRSTARNRCGKTF